MNSNSCSDSSNDSMANPLQMNFGQPQMQMQMQSLQQERYVWEMRTRSPNVTPASTVLNSPDLNAELPYAPLQGQSPGQLSMGYGETGGQMSSSYYYQRPHLHQIRVGRSPGSQFDAHESSLPQGRASPGSPTDVGKADGQCLRDGEIVVFDDIDTNWMNKAASALRSDSQEDILKVTKMIGQLPIAEYEGSPRRFGNQPATVPAAATSMASNSGSRKRPPGFPQRVSPTTSGSGVAGKASSGNLIDLNDHEEDSRMAAAAREKTPAFDYLYEFSETRKVLEEFFKANPDDEKRFADYTTESGDDVPNAQQQQQPQQQPVHEHNGNANGPINGERLENEYNNSASLATVTTDASQSALISDFASLPMPMPPPPPLPLPCTPPQIELPDTNSDEQSMQAEQATAAAVAVESDCCSIEQSHYGAVYEAGSAVQQSATAAVEIQEAMKEIRTALQRAKTQPDKLKFCDEVLPTEPESPVWVPRKCEAAAIGIATAMPATAAQEEEPDTDLETDRLLGQQRHEEQDFFSDLSQEPDSNANEGTEIASNGHLNGGCIDNNNPKPQTYSSATIRQGIGTSLTPNSPDICQIVGTADITISGSPEKLQFTKSPTGSIKSLKDSANSDKKAKSRNKEGLLEPKVLIEGVLFRAKYLGSTQLVCEGQPTKSTRMMQAEEAVSRIKALAPEGESQPSTEVDLFISTEKIMVLNTDLKEIMMDHALRTISYIADIGDLVVLMARRRFVPNSLGDSNPSPSPNPLGDVSNPTVTVSVSASEAADSSPPKEPLQALHSKHNRTPKMICHVFESDEAQFIAQSIGQAFQVAYMEFLKANGIENENLAKEMDYQEVLNSQEIFGDELEIFAKKELQKEVVVPKAKGEILGVVIVESGWGSMLPTVVIANLMSTGAAARCGQLNIGDQLIAINGMSLVGLPLSTCQSYIRNAKNQTAVKFTVVPCPPVVEVKILRPKALFQLGFSVQNGVICSLLRGGIAERGGVRVGHRIIEINNQSVVAVPHDTIVKLLSSSVGEILMKTMPTSMFRLLTGQETPIYI
ncbi:uncharacterized protein LOC117889922 isoform X5 [Drosophila subobscura]|uniref:uncharacterized protein LOC117889922 isoform X5 n=1 Tax=Drosophila subobscura TaxID=7241 RepID=UPI00155B37A9|nr:uncharacterized protein LOC117889922 isoform X5 [Drosophila subobscura]